MSMPGSDFGRVTVFVALIALGGGLMAQSAGQTTQDPPTQPTANGNAPPSERALVDQVTGKPLIPNAAPVRTREGFRLDPSGVALNPQAAGPAPGTAAGEPSPVKVFGKVGPDGKVIGRDAPSSPDGPAKVT